MFPNNQKELQLKEEILDLKDKINELKQRLHAHEDAEHSASFSIDWSALDVFSIERNPQKQPPQTTIGYKVIKEQVVDGVKVFNLKTEEWYYCCSLAEHERLVKEFNEYIASKKS